MLPALLSGLSVESARGALAVLTADRAIHFSGTTRTRLGATRGRQWSSPMRQRIVCLWRLMLLLRYVVLVRKRLTPLRAEMAAENDASANLQLFHSLVNAPVQGGFVRY
jgi:hypothetical protein